MAILYNYIRNVYCHPCHRKVSPNTCKYAQINSPRVGCLLRLVFTYCRNLAILTMVRRIRWCKDTKCLAKIRQINCFYFAFFNSLCRFRSAFSSAKRLRSAFMSTRKHGFINSPKSIGSCSSSNHSCGMVISLRCLFVFIYQLFIGKTFAPSPTHQSFHLANMLP